jgi:hypothetical protein
MITDQLKKLEIYIEKRKIRSNNNGKGLNISINKMQYLNNVILSKKSKKYENALFVGVGHGHDVLLHLINENIKKADGVDPYFAEDGNDDYDYKNLIDLTKHIGLDKKLTVYKNTIQTYLNDCKKNYDLIILPDVLHHIFVTKDLLNQSQLFEKCVDLFKSFYTKTNYECDLIITDAPRFGFRPNLVKRGLIKTNVNYETKQPFNQWKFAAEEAGWKHISTEFYIPYALRHFSLILKIPILSWFISNRYILKFKKIENK